MNNVPNGTTHVWTPAVDMPYVCTWIFRRAYYKFENNKWYSFSESKEWLVTRNDAEWFDEETALGYFVPIATFLAPGFKSVKEAV